MGFFDEVEKVAYAKAGAIASDVITKIKTVMAYGLMELETENYLTNLTGAYRAGFRKAMTLSIGTTIGLLFDFGTYSLAMW